MNEGCVLKMKVVAFLKMYKFTATFYLSFYVTVF